MFIARTIIEIVSQLLFLLVFVDALMSYFLSPFHPVRQRLDAIVEPMLAPIRRIVPSVGMIDFSPLILIILIQVISSILINLLS